MTDKINIRETKEKKMSHKKLLDAERIAQGKKIKTLI
jgi:hypothetical protein